MQTTQNTGLSGLLYLKEWFLKLGLIVFMTLMGSTGYAKGSAEVNAAENHIITVSNNILRQLDVNKSKLKNNPNALTALVRKEILPFIDFNAMAKLTLGKHWRSATPAQRTRFVNAYRNMLVRSYAKQMLNYAGATMRPKFSTANKKPGYVTVRTLVVPKNGAAVAATYEVRNKTGSWKVYNVEIGGINMVTNFRTNFSREVSAKGLNALILRLEKIR